MKPGNLNLPIIWRGCDWPIITLRWKDLNGNPFNLTGWFPYASTTKFSLNAKITDAPNGVTTINLTHAETLALKLGELEWSWLWSYVSTGDITPPVLAGRVIVKQPVINSPVAPVPGEPIVPHPEPLPVSP
jgi:hypothetical protein